MIYFPTAGDPSAQILKGKWYSHSNGKSSFTECVCNNNFQNMREQKRKFCFCMKCEQKKKPVTKTREQRGSSQTQESLQFGAGDECGVRLMFPLNLVDSSQRLSISLWPHNPKRRAKWQTTSNLSWCMVFHLHQGGTRQRVQLHIQLVISLTDGCLKQLNLTLLVSN